MSEEEIYNNHMSRQLGLTDTRIRKTQNEVAQAPFVSAKYAHEDVESLEEKQGITPVKTATCSHVWLSYFIVAILIVILFGYMVRPSH